ncbi:MAG: TlpA family protein disulfide reductase [Myxococcota bacterium]|nr:TlpA family protein disulfide reductase [Myxococcota bacterium]
MDEANKTPSSFYAPLRVPPPGVSPNAQAGRGLSVGGRQVSWIIDGDSYSGYVLFYDRGGDGDLSDEAPVPFVLTSTGWNNVMPARSTWEVTVRAFGETPENRPTELVFRIRIRNATVTVEYTNTRAGRILVRGKSVRFSVTGIWGYYGLAPLRVFFDLDGDGDLEVDEWRYVRDKRVVLAGLPYAFRVSDSGDSLTLKPVKAASNYVRSPLTPGEPVKDVALFSIRGADVSLGKFRNKYVLLDFWSMSCPPCVVAIPQIARIANSQSAVVIGITPDANDERLAKFIAAHNVTWDIVSQDHDSARIYSRLQIDRFPSYLLIGPDGRLVCAECSLEQVEELTTSGVVLP